MTVFIDTNVLVYSRDPANREKQDKAGQWLKYLWKLRLGRVSTQVLNEFYYTATTKLRPGISRNVARIDVENMSALNPLIIEFRHLQAAFTLEDRYGLNYWDALIVATAEAAGCSHLLTEDLQHDQQLGSVLVISPFLVDPESI